MEVAGQEPDRQVLSNLKLRCGHAVEFQNRALSQARNRKPQPNKKSLTRNRKKETSRVLYEIARAFADLAAETILNAEG